MQIHWVNETNIYKTLPAAETPLDTMPLGDLTECAVTLQDAATRAQREADAVRRVLFARRRQAIAEGVDVPDPVTVAGLPGWTDQFRAETIAESNHQIDVQAGRAPR